MIRLDIQEYCSECFEFDPDVMKPMKKTVYVGINEPRFQDQFVTKQSDTIVSCKHAKRCESIKRYLEKKTNSSDE